MAVQATAVAKARPRYEQRRLEVLRAAATTFNRKGFHVATLDDVAEDLGVTKPALYYYARSKDELLAACGELAIASLQTALDSAEAAGRSAASRLSGFFTLYAQVICGDFGRCLVLTEPRDLAPESRVVNLAGRRSLNLAVRQMIDDGVAAGEFGACDVRAVAIALFDAFNGLAKWFDPKGSTKLESLVEQYLALFLHGLAREPAAR
ncbi:MAG TPA: TetR/AcrR family transcriptional regulator [Caulobacteraceae bacterium]|jgi:AcrR family transcriptional regulator|nr:TetR/AcrR family transcriptional regulator [Caulobacteraceae bacterium]